MFIKKHIMYALEAPKHDDAKVNNGVELIGGRPLMVMVSEDGRASKVDGANEGGGAKLNNGGANWTGEKIANDVGGGGASEDDGVNKSSGTELNEDGASGTGGPTVNGIGASESGGANKGCYMDEDDENCDERYFNGYSNFYTNDHIDYGYLDVYGSQGVEHEDAGAAGSLRADCGGIGVAQQTQDQEKQHIGSAVGKQVRAHCEDKHGEYGSIDTLLDDTQCWELNSNPGSSEDEGTEG
ncbi:hypothetical protein ACH5RR_015691 [Cinchona calisaya]|uniref:Uncharacterized protein n=1 Tax=Cinchona calisaya TaxID=153742 RepID=A0ABD2ZXG2_9GENT